MKTNSYWHMTFSAKSFPQLCENLEVDNLIVGGGITGVTTAYCLANKGEGAETVLIEKDEICAGGTGNTTAKISVQHDRIYSRLLNEQDFGTAKMYYEAQTDAAEFIKKTIKKEKIECDYIGNSSYIYSLDEKESEDVEKEYEAAMRLEIPSKFILQPPFPKDCVSMTAFFNQAVFHPIKYVSALAEKAAEKGVRIFCHTKAVLIKDADTFVVTLENGVVIKAKNLVIATQYPCYEDKNFFFTKLFAKRGYAAAVIGARDYPDGSYKSAGEPSRSIRKHYDGGECVTIAQGETHATGRSEDMEEHFKNILAFCESEMGVKKALTFWSMQDYETPDGMPFIGKIDHKSHVYVGTGYSKWGMTNGTLAGMMLADLIAAGGNKYEDMFSPFRKMKMAPEGKMMSEVAGSVGELLKSKVEHIDDPSDIKAGEGKVVTYKGKRAGLYLNEFGDAIILDISCKHMGTTLNYNSAERTWDCPAHGSRFALNGKVIEGPAKESLKELFRGKLSDLELKMK